MVSSKAVRQALYEKLNTAPVTSLLANGSASLFHSVAPPTAEYPFVIFHKQAGTPRLRFGGQAYKEHVWLVKAVTRNHGKPLAGPAEDLDAAINNLLDFGTLTISGGHLMIANRESDVDFTETDGDRVYSHVGGLYRLAVRD